MKKRGSRRPRPLPAIRALVLDVDGVLTDGGLYYGPQGEPLRRFHVRDGMGLRLAREAGLKIAFISGESGGALRRRARKLQVTEVYAGVEDKLGALLGFVHRHRLRLEDVAYIGDDLNDIPPMRRAGLAIAVADAAPEVLRIAHRVTSRRGGDGAVREICDALLAARR